ncbi:ABC-type molybdate transport system, periplasmiccomponent [Halapricum desulfuricans]|uniref:ABC-type molybdate transport system, periplasmiccomponent n=1 Tax=Halapricum desulfuricans TaxID=2841257 RepID=A0A897N0M3_9EURY|nr:ABC-type molybdate transport system, periplasmiccomponent [Halapricum desulfuricans]
MGPAFESETGITVQGEYFGSNAVMRMVEDGTKHPDVVVSADATLLRDRLVGTHTDWDVEFATNVLGIGYNADTGFGSKMAAGEQEWYDLIRETEQGDIAISNPEQDPLGYRAWQAFGLAEREHDIEGFREEVWDLVEQVAEEPQVLGGVEGGSRAGAVVYGNMARDHDIPFEPFPAAYNFADPSLADHYATAEYTFEQDGTTVEGRPILYNATVLDRADAPENGRRLVEFLASNPDDVLGEAGLATADSLPRAHGTLPDGLTI